MVKIMAIEIDSKEPAWAKRLNFTDEIVTTVSNMKTGDYKLWLDNGDIVIIERKKSDDFLGSVADDRIFNQVARLAEMRSETTHVYLLVTDFLHHMQNGFTQSNRGGTGWRWNSVNGALLTIQEMGVPVSFGSDNRLESSILMLGNRKHSPVKVAPHREIEMVSEKAAFLMGIPNVGDVKASAILQLSNSNLSHALMGITDIELPNIRKKVGAKTQDKIRAFLGLKENERLEVVTK